MKIKTPYYYKDFKCIASKCSDTCCAGWEIIIDKHTYSKYKNLKNDFGKKLNSQIMIYEDNEPGFKLKNNNCYFLNSNLLCDIYSNLGEDYLCYTCKTFPRIINEYGNLREICLSLSCPEAARLILKDSKKLNFDIVENDEVVSTYNSISPDLYIQLLGSRQIAFNIIQNTEFNLNTRIAVLLQFASDIQEKIDSCELSKISEIRKKYSDKTFINNLAIKINTSENDLEKKYELIHKYLNIFNELEEINKSWTDTVNHSIELFFTKNNFNFLKHSIEQFNNYYKDNLYEFENIFTYFLSRYFLTSLYDADLLSKVKLSILSMFIIKVLDTAKFIDNNFKFSLEDSINISHMYSKDIEHSDSNIEKLYTMFNECEIFNINNFFTILID